MNLKTKAGPFTIRTGKCPDPGRNGINYLTTVTAPSDTVAQQYGFPSRHIDAIPASDMTGARRVHQREVTDFQHLIQGE